MTPPKRIAVVNAGAPVAFGRETRTVVSPKRTSSPPRKSTSITARPLTLVPFVEPRSVQRKRSPTASTAAWRRETSRSVKRSSHADDCPMSSRDGSVGSIVFCRPVSGPSITSRTNARPKATSGALGTGRTSVAVELSGSLASSNVTADS